VSDSPTTTKAAPGGTACIDKDRQRGSESRVHKGSVGRVGSRSKRKGNEVWQSIRIEEYTCDFCSKPIKLDEVYSGTLAVRKRGARGRGTEVVLSMYQRCIPVPVVPSNGAKRSRVAAKA
jgi:hypothetical protein